MRASILLAACAALAVAAACTSSGQQEGSASAAPTPLPPFATWITYRDPAGVFEARFPTDPTVKEDRPAGDAEISDKRLTSISAQFSDEENLFSVARIELADVKGYDCAGGLVGMVKSSLEAMGCNADEDRERAFGPLPGREVEFSCSKRPMRGVMRVGCDVRELDKGRVHAYSTMAAGRNESWRGDQARSFLDSFVLVGAEPIKGR